MFGALSSNDGALDRPDTGDGAGWYARDTGESGLRESCNGKSGSGNCMLLVGDAQSMACGWDLSDFLRGICLCAGAALAVELSASPASRKKSWISASASLCLPISEVVMRAPNAAVVLLALDMFEVSSKEVLLVQE